MNKTNEKKVLVLSFLGVLTFIAVVVGATYAYFQAQGGGSGNTNIKIGLMYASDYGYGANPNKWTSALWEDHYGTDNWLYLGDYEWLISRHATDASLAFSVIFFSGGSVGNNTVRSADAVRPSFSLASKVEISSGTETSTDNIA